MHKDASASRATRLNVRNTHLRLSSAETSCSASRPNLEENTTKVGVSDADGSPCDKFGAPDA